MPIYVKDTVATELLNEVVALSGGKNKTQVVLTALRNERDRLSKKTTPSERIAPLQARLAQLGDKDPNFDMKAFSDEMSG